MLSNNKHQYYTNQYEKAVDHVKNINSSINKFKRTSGNITIENIQSVGSKLNNLNRLVENTRSIYKNNHEHLFGSTLNNADIPKLSEMRATLALKRIRQQKRAEKAAANKAVAENAAAKKAAAEKNASEKADAIKKLKNRLNSLKQKIGVNNKKSV
jgi:hypothetical protein